MNSLPALHQPQAAVRQVLEGYALVVNVHLGFAKPGARLVSQKTYSYSLHVSATTRLDAGFETVQRVRASGPLGKCVGPGLLVHLAASTRWLPTERWSGEGYG